MINSTVSKESAPKSSTKDASGVTSDSSTPSCSTMIFFTFSGTSTVRSPPHPPARRTHTPDASHPQAPVDMDDMTRDVRRVIRGKENDQFRHLFRCAEPAHGNLGAHLLLKLRVQGVRHVRFNE